MAWSFPPATEKNNVLFKNGVCVLALSDDWPEVDKPGCMKIDGDSLWRNASLTHRQATHIQLHSKPAILLHVPSMVDARGNVVVEVRIKGAAAAEDKAALLLPLNRPLVLFCPARGSLAHGYVRGLQQLKVVGRQIAVDEGGARSVGPVGRRAVHEMNVEEDGIAGSAVNWQRSLKAKLAARRQTEMRRSVNVRDVTTFVGSGHNVEGTVVERDLVGRGDVGDR